MQVVFLNIIMSPLNSVYLSHEIDIYIPLHNVNPQTLFPEKELASVPLSNRMTICVLVAFWE